MPGGACNPCETSTCSTSLSRILALPASLAVSYPGKDFTIWGQSRDSLYLKNCWKCTKWNVSNLCHVRILTDWLTDRQADRQNWLLKPTMYMCTKGYVFLACCKSATPVSCWPHAQTIMSVLSHATTSGVVRCTGWQKALWEFTAGVAQTAKICTCIVHGLIW